MRELYDRLIAEGEAGIERLIHERTQEGLQLDFKLKGHASHGAFEDTDKKTLAKAVSGFGNSAGGLIVWGVNAEKVDGVDCAQSPAVPIANIEQFASEAATLVGQLVQPRHDGVYINYIRSSTSAGSGYLLIYIQRSERRPHRSEAKGQKQYFKRAGDSFFEMEHYDIEDAFAREVAPELDITLKNAGWAGSGVERDISIHVIIQNLSNYLARYPYLVIEDINCLSWSYANLNPSNMRALADHRKIVIAGGADHVIHPGLDLAAAGLILHGTKIDDTWVVGGVPLDKAVFSFDYTVGCAGGRARSGRYVMRASEFFR